MLSAVHWGTRGAGLLLMREDGKVLLALRSNLVHEPHTWGIPGGRVEPGETDLDTAIFEFAEEMGSTPKLTIADSYTLTLPDGFTYTTFVACAGDLSNWRPELNWENIDWGWFSLAELPRPLHPGVKDALNSFRRQRCRNA